MTAAPLYEIFARYAYAGRKFCDFCYTKEEWREISRTPVSALSVEHSQKLLGETADHWESPDVYKHYLPRVLEVLSAPWNAEPIYPLHLSETMLALKFSEWSPNEQQAVVDYLSECTPNLRWLSHPENQKEWAAGLVALRKAQHAATKGG